MAFGELDFGSVPRTIHSTMVPPSTSKPVIGLVGGIGAGKSAAAAEFARLGCLLIDADAIGHALLGDAAVADAIRSRWGREVFGPGGQVDRKALGEIVFADAQELAALNEILHPRIRRRMHHRIAAARRDVAVPVVVVDAAVLLEAGWDDLCTHLVFVRATDEQRARRVRADRQWDRRTWRQREKSQFSLDRKAQSCDHTLDSSGSASHLNEQVHRLFHRIVR